MILIYSDSITERLQYTLSFLFSERELAYKITNDGIQFQDFEGVKVNYSERFFEDTLSISPAAVLFDEHLFDYALTKVPFHTDFCLAFDGITDPIASIFFVLSRMEEYIVTQRDKHDRFQAKSSVQFENGWLDKAICDRWAILVLDFISKNTDFSYEIRIQKPTLIPTFDIDHVRAFEWKEGMRTQLSKLRDWLRKDLQRISLRKKVLSGKVKDPYNTFDTIVEVAKRFPKTRVFWMVGDYAKYDKNVGSYDIRHQQEIQRIAATTRVGLHPSYRSNENFQLLELEKKRLENILGSEIHESRQHFLKLKLPFTYQRLLEVDFDHDFTMGYADEVGFRNGTARPFPFFDLTSNSVTSLIIYPFVYMDGTLNEYIKFSIEEAKKQIQKLYQECLEYGGDFVFIWHNETIGNFSKWENWIDVFEFTLELDTRES